MSIPVSAPISSAPPEGPRQRESSPEKLVAASEKSTRAARLALKQALSYAVGETLFPVAGGLGILYLIFGVAHHFTLQPPQQFYMMGTAFGTTVALGLLAFAVRRWPVHNGYAHLLSSLIAAFVLLNSLLHMRFTNDPLQSSNFMLLLVGVGFFLLSTRYFVGALVVIFLCWGMTIVQIGGDGATVTHFSFGLLSAAVLATLLHSARKRMLTRLTLLRWQDELRAARLQLALEAEQESEAALRLSEANYRRLNQELAARAHDLHLVNQELAKASQSKDEFLASMSHELRTPLTAILGLTESLQEAIYGPLNQRQQAALHNITESGRHLLMLINDILDVAKTEAGKLTLQLTPADVPLLCDVSLRLVRPEARQKSITLLSQLDQKATLFLADERRLKQMLVNLLSNAIKFTGEGGSVGLDVVGDTATGIIRFTVWDSGIGIADEDLPRLFKPFIQLDSKLSRHYAGSGLGLVLVYRMAEMHGGSVSVESQVQQGSRFTVRLPWRPVIRNGAGKLTDTVTPQATPLARATRTILVIDSQELSGEWITTQTARVGCAVERVSSYSAALTWLENTTPALILVDIHGEHGDGLAFVREVRTRPQTQQLPLIAMSALVLPDTAQVYLENGATHFCAKPLPLPLLAALLTPA